MQKDFKFYYFKFKNKFGQRKIETLAEELKTFIDNLNLKKGEKISIIAFSVGGLISEYYLKFIDNKQVDKIITICSPFKGTPWASIFFKKRIGMRELQERSIFLKKLNKEKMPRTIKQESIWDEEDFIVPHKLAKQGKAKRTLFFLHPLIEFWPPTILEIKKFLQSK